MIGGASIIVGRPNEPTIIGDFRRFATALVDIQSMVAQREPTF